VSPIFVRPVREQLEHDRLTRFLVAKYKRKSDVSANVGDEQGTPVKIGPSTYYPDLVLTDGRRLTGLVEVESGESVNNLEAMAQWVPFSKARVPFHLYVPMTAFDAARRFCDAHHARVAEIWTYRATNDGFDLVRMFHDSTITVGKTPGATLPAPKKPVVPPVAPPKPEPAAKPAPVAKPAPGTKPAPAAKPAPATKPAPSVKPAAAVKPAPPKPVAAKPAPAKPVPAKPVATKPVAKPASKPAAPAKSPAARKPAKPSPAKKAKPVKAKAGKR